MNTHIDWTCELQHYSAGIGGCCRPLLVKRSHSCCEPSKLLSVFSLFISHLLHFTAQISVCHPGITCGKCSVLFWGSTITDIFNSAGSFINAARFISTCLVCFVICRIILTLKHSVCIPSELKPLICADFSPGRTERRSGSWTDVSGHLSTECSRTTWCIQTVNIIDHRFIINGIKNLKIWAGFDPWGH